MNDIELFPVPGGVRQEECFKIVLYIVHVHVAVQRLSIFGYMSRYTYI